MRDIHTNVNMWNELIQQCDLCSMEGYDITLGCMSCNYRREINMAQVRTVLDSIQLKIQTAYNIRQSVRNPNDVQLTSVCGAQLIEVLETEHSRLSWIIKENLSDRDIHISTIKRLMMAIEQQLHDYDMTRPNPDYARGHHPTDRRNRLENELDRLKAQMAFYIG